MQVVKGLLKLLTEKHGKELDLDNGEVYYLFMKGAVVSVWKTNDGAFCMEVEELEAGKAHVYYSREHIQDFIK